MIDYRRILADIPANMSPVYVAGLCLSSMFVPAKQVRQEVEEQGKAELTITESRYQTLGIRNSAYGESSLLHYINNIHVARCLH